MEEFKQITRLFLKRRQDLISCLSLERPTVDDKMDFTFDKFQDRFEELKEQIPEGFDIDDVNVKLLYLEDKMLSPGFWYFQFAKKSL